MEISEEKTKLTVVKDGVEEIKEMNKPTPEEVEQFKNEFEEAKKNFEEAKWQISENGNFAANDVGIFILEFMEKFGFWTKTGWMGMLKMEEELKNELSLVDENSGLKLNYQALEFCAYMLSSPGGIGINAAKEFEKIAEKYSKIGVVIGQKVEEARATLKDIQYLQEKWAAAEQGFFLADLEPKEDEKPEGETKTVVLNPTEEESS